MASQPQPASSSARAGRRAAAAARAQARQPPRADRRRDRHRQDRHPAGHRRRAVATPASRPSSPTSRATSPASPCPARRPPRPHEAFAARAAEIGYTDWRYDACPVQLWDLFGEQGHPIRTTVSEMGPLLLARLMNLNEVQEGVLTIAFHVADKDGLLLLDLDDLQAMLVACRRARRRADARIWQCRQDLGRRDPALPAPAARAGRRPFLRRAGARPRGFPQARRGRQGDRQHPRRRPADGQPAALFDLPAVAAVANCSSCSPRSATPTSPSSLSSSTRRICCSTTPRRRCSKRSSRSSA